MDAAVVWIVVGVVALAGVAWNLAALVWRDGYGSNPAPRSHVEELDARARR